MPIEGMLIAGDSHTTALVALPLHREGHKGNHVVPIHKYGHDVHYLQGDWPRHPVDYW